jgi:hypothetical protein
VRRCSGRVLGGRDGAAAGRGGTSVGRRQVGGAALGGRGPLDPALPQLRPLLALADPAGIRQWLVVVAVAAKRRGRRPHGRGRSPWRVLEPMRW